MTTETIEGTAVEVTESEPIRAMVVAQPGQQLVSEVTDRNGGPRAMIAVASELASALKDIVERQNLYTVISGKKFPQVEAWMTIGRMDNVVAREAERPIRNDDGSYEAFVELVRLSDGMVIGRASALCGTSDDRPWATRSEPARRSMAVTRATSRAFRQQYSWIMALAGYEPTPADEMPDERGETHQPDQRSRAANAKKEVLDTYIASDDLTGAQVKPVVDALDKRAQAAGHDAGGLVGTAEVGKGQADFELRQTPNGMKIEFRLTSGRGGIKAVAVGPLAEAIATVKATIIGQRVTCWGSISDETFRPRGSQRDVTYQVLTLSRIQTPEMTLPSVSVVPDEDLAGPPDDIALVGETA